MIEIPLTMTINNNNDSNKNHMRISGTEASSVILSQKVVSKVGKWCHISTKTS